MGARQCNNCCSGTEIEGDIAKNQSEAGKDGLAPVWEEENVDAADAKLFGQLKEVLTKPAFTGRSQWRLEFVLGGRGGEIGLELLVLPEPAPPALVVATVDQEGQLARTRDGGPGLSPGDAILEVEDVPKSAEDLFDALRELRMAKAATVAIMVRRRPTSFNVQLRREGTHWRRLGLSIALRPKDGVLLIAAVHLAGLAQEWNARNNTHCICVGDRIVAVNGIQGDAFAAYQAIQATGLNGELTLRVEPPLWERALDVQAWAQKALQPESEEVLESL